MQTGSGRYVFGGRTGWIRLSVAVGLIFVIGFVFQIATVQGASLENVQPLVIPSFDHVVIVIEENKGYADVIGKEYAPYINSLGSQGAVFTNAHGDWHPSQPNYFALFSGSMQNIVGDDCPLKTLAGQSPHLDESLGGTLLARYTNGFGAYAENLPQKDIGACFAYVPQGSHQLKETNDDPGKKDARNDQYARKHNPWVSFTNLQGKIHDGKLFPNYNVDYAAHPQMCSPTNASVYNDLPVVSFVIPNNQNDMHTGQSISEEVSRGDTWLKQHLSCYAEWAMNHNSLLIVTWDEDSSTDACKGKDAGSGVCEMTYPDKGQHTGTIPENNIIPTIFAGAHVKAGQYSEWINHYNILRTLEDMYRLKYLGVSASVQSIADVWQ